MPHVAPPASTPMAGSASDHIHFHGGVYEKQMIRKVPEKSAGEAKEGLGALFGSAETSGGK